MTTEIKKEIDKIKKNIEALKAHLLLLETVKI
jgi:hypothetical protein